MAEEKKPTKCCSGDGTNTAACCGTNNKVGKEVESIITDDCCASGKCHKEQWKEEEDHHHQTTTTTPEPCTVKANLYKNTKKTTIAAAASAASSACQEPHGNPDCVAILREDGNVDIYDVAGDCMTFCADDDSSKKKLCFSSHGHVDIEPYLTPCFDEDGNHGDPEEDCYCGEEGPHLHAHLHSDATCHDTKQKKHDKFQLALVTLKPKEAEVSQLPLLPTMPKSPSLPIACNALQLEQSLVERGVCAQKFNASKQPFKKNIAHDDHVDMLVHNPNTGLVTLEHDCQDCGHMDIHGTLAYAAQRRSFHDGDKTKNMIQINFYEIPKTPMKLLDVLGGFFALEEGKAQVMRSAFPTTTTTTSNKKKARAPCCNEDGTCNAQVKDDSCPSVANTVDSNELVDEEEETVVVKSTLHVKGICCAAEIPMVHSIVEPLIGVSKVVGIATTTKLVHFMHDPTVITAEQVMLALNKQKFNASIRKDGGAAAKTTTFVAAAANTTTTTVGRSTFLVSGICCAAEIPAINQILEPLKGVQKVSINVPNKMVYVEHEFDLIAAKDIKAALDQERFFSKVEKDAQAEALSTTEFMSKYVESTFLITTSLLEQKDAERIKDVLREHYSKEKLSHSQVHVPSKTIKIDHNPKLVLAGDLTKFLQDSVGLDLSLIADGFKEGIWSAGEDEMLDEEQAHLQWPVILSGIFWIVSMLHFIGGNWDYLKYAGILSVLLGIPGIASKAFLTMKRRQFDTNCMMLFATIGELRFYLVYHAISNFVFLTFLCFMTQELLPFKNTARRQLLLFFSAFPTGWKPCQLHGPEMHCQQSLSFVLNVQRCKTRSVVNLFLLQLRPLLLEALFPFELGIRYPVMEWYLKDPR